MRKNDSWKFAFVVFVIFWSFYQIYPPTSRDLVSEFASHAENPDATFSNILQRVESVRQANTNAAEFMVLQDAIGTNDIQPYFPYIDAKAQLYPTTYILNQIQRDASGKIKLGLDLQGGTSFLVEMDTNFLASAVDTNKVAQSAEISGAIS